RDEIGFEVSLCPKEFEFLFALPRQEPSDPGLFLQIGQVLPLCCSTLLILALCLYAALNVLGQAIRRQEPAERDRGRVGRSSSSFFKACRIGIHQIGRFLLTAANPIIPGNLICLLLPDKTFNLGDATRPENGARLVDAADRDLRGTIA